MFSVEPQRLILHRATPEAAGTYQVVVSNSHGDDKQELQIKVEPRRLRQRGPPAIRLAQDQYSVGSGQSVDVIPNIAVKSKYIFFANLN